jgi:hypothetical protein
MVQPPDIRQSLIHGGRNQALWVGNIISEVFGISSPIYIPWGNNKSFPPGDYEIPVEGWGQTGGYENVRLISQEKGDELSEFGTPVLGVVEFRAGTYNMYDRMSGQVKRVSYGSYTLPYSCICEFSRESNVITTNVLGNTGTVKELFGLGDWNINIRGIAVNSGNMYRDDAHEQIKKLTQWSNICDAINIGGAVFANKDISRVVIKSINIQPIEAKYNVIPFQIEMISDEPLELTL